MKAVILFHNIGGYHAARIRAAQLICQKKGWQLAAIQETESAQEHPWGDLDKEITFPLHTLLASQESLSVNDRAPESTLAASRLPVCLQRIKPDMLIIPGWGYPISRAALQWAKEKNLPTVLLSESKWDDSPRSWWKEKLKSWLYTRHFKSALVGGKLHRDYLVQLGFPKKGIFLGYDIVDNDHFSCQAQQAKQFPQASRAAHPQIPKKPFFISVTRFIPRKNVLRMIEAFVRYRQMTASEASWDLVICGSGEEEPNIREKIAQHQLEDFIHLPGFKTYQDIPSWFGLANAFIHPALSEQWGLVVNEALASGLPALVSNRCGCFPELIQEGRNGFGFDPENIEALALLMLKVSQGEVDLTQMSQSAIEHIQQFSPNAFGHGFAQAVEYALTH